MQRLALGYLYRENDDTRHLSFVMKKLQRPFSNKRLTKTRLPDKVVINESSA